MKAFNVKHDNSMICLFYEQQVILAAILPSSFCELCLCSRLNCKLFFDFLTFGKFL